MTMRAGTILAVSFAVAGLAGQPARANLVVNPTFSTGSFTPGWSPSGASIEVQSGAFAPAADTFYASFTGSSDTLSQSIATTPGQAYTLSFSLLSEGSFFLDTFTVDFGTFSTSVAGTAASGGYQSEVFTIPGADITASSTALSFQGVNPSTSNWDLDDVSVVTKSTAAPEPPVGALLAGAALAMIALRRGGRRVRIG